MNRLARPYAQALIGAAGSLDEAETIQSELSEFLEMTQQVPALATMAVSPSVPIEAKQKVLEAVADAASFLPLTRRFLNALLTRHRLGYLGEILAGLTEMVNAERGVVVATVQSAEPLSGDASQRLASVLASRLGKQVELDLNVNPKLLAGFVVRIGSNYYDASVKGQLDRLTADLARV